MSWRDVHDLIMACFTEDRVYHTAELVNETRFSFTDIVFQLDRLMKQGELEYLGDHRWKKIAADSSETAESGA